MKAVKQHHRGRKKGRFLDKSQVFDGFFELSLIKSRGNVLKCIPLSQNSEITR